MDGFCCFLVQKSSSLHHSSSAQRQRCGTAGGRQPERSERRTLPAVATTVLFVFFIFCGRGSRVIESTIAWVIVAGSFIAGTLASEWIYDRRRSLLSRLRSRVSWLRLSIAIFCDAAFCLAAMRSWAARIRVFRCASVSERSSSISRKNFSCRANSRHCNMAPKMNASDAANDISHTRIQSNDVVTSAIMSSNSQTNV